MISNNGCKCSTSLKSSFAGCADKKGEQVIAMVSEASLKKKKHVILCSLLVKLFFYLVNLLLTWAPQVQQTYHYHPDQAVVKVSPDELEVLGPAFAGLSFVHCHWCSLYAHYCPHDLPSKVVKSKF